MYTGEEIIHTTASENLTFATGWLFFSIVLGSILTFTFFSAISASFYCCQKPIKKKDEDKQSLLNTGNSSQKLLFPNVPSTVYPTVQSILQQEDNEVIDSLSPAYRELPSTHFSYVSSFNGSSFIGSTTIDLSSCGNNQTTILPDSTKSSVHPHTNSLSSEQLNIQRLSNDSTISQRNTSNIDPINTDCTITQERLSLTNPDLIDDSSQSIHIITAPEDPQRCTTSSTSGIITEGNLTIQREGASSLGSVELSPKARAFSPDYYALTFRREGSGLSDVSCGSLRGASVFAGSFEQQRSPIMMSPARVHERGASVFGQTSEGLETGDFFMNETEEQSNRQSKLLNLTHESLLNYKGSQLETERFCTVEATRDQPEISNYTHESPINDKAAKISPSSNHSVSKITGNSAHSENTEANSSKLQCENQYLERPPTFTNTRSVSSINKRSKSSTNVRSYRANAGQSERATGIRSSLENDSRNNNSKKSTTQQIHNSSEIKKSTTPQIHNSLEIKKSITPQIYNSSEMNSNKNPLTLSKNHITSNSQQHGALDKLITTLPSRENTSPITTRQNTPRDSSKPIKPLDLKSNPKTHNLNTTYQSLRGASQLGRLGDDDVCSDSDAFWDSVSLSFAYESPGEEDEF